MKTRIKLIMLLLSLVLPAISTRLIGVEKLSSSDSTYYYEAVKILSEKGTEGITEINFRNFRYSYFQAVQQNMNLTISPEDEQELNASIRSGDYPAVIKAADKILNKNFTNIRAHILKAFAQFKLNLETEFHRLVYNELINSILNSGDGKTPETACQVFQVDEEYDILNYFGLKMRYQALISNKGRDYDMLECEDEEGNVTTIYFDITEHMKSLEKLFTGNSD